ncbi:hypothetical protein P9112_005663 [Eukaryota sp. TZLM1-RC]
MVPVDELQSLKCPIHQGVLIDAVVLSCGHTLCHLCAAELLSCSQVRCPVCSDVSSSELLPNYTVHNVISELDSHIPPDQLLTPDELFELGRKHYYLGTTESRRRAIRFITRAAEQGHGRAANSLGLCYRDGHGVGQDLISAERWFKKAVQAGYPDARKNLHNLNQLCSLL